MAIVSDEKVLILRIPAIAFLYLLGGSRRIEWKTVIGEAPSLKRRRFPKTIS